jgi:uncharacterized OB-fold protein
MKTELKEQGTETPEIVYPMTEGYPKKLDYWVCTDCGTKYVYNIDGCPYCGSSRVEKIVYDC